MTVEAGNDLRTQFRTPPREFGMIPDWFWDDEPEEQEIRRQLREFHRKGFAGVMIFGGVSVPARVGYLTAEWFRALGVALEEAARLEMKVLLWDEGGYPSGSAHGLVVQENPAYAIHEMVVVDQAVVGPAAGYWLPSPGPAVDDRLL